MLSLQFEMPSIGQPLLWPLLEPFFQQQHQLEQHGVEAVRSNIGVPDVIVAPDVMLMLLMLLTLLLLLLLLMLMLMLLLLLLLLLLLRLLLLMLSLSLPLSPPL